MVVRGVGSRERQTNCVVRFGNVVPFRSPILSWNLLGSSKISSTRGVCNNPYSVAPMGGLDGASWNNKRLDFVAFAFQVKYTAFELHVDEASNVFTNDPRGPCLFDNAEHFRPEIAVIILTSLEPASYRVGVKTYASNGYLLSRTSYMCKISWLIFLRCTLLLRFLPICAHIYFQCCNSFLFLRLPFEIL